MLTLYFDIDVFVWLMTGFACLLSWQQPVRKPQKCLCQHLCQLPVCPQVRPRFLSNPPNESVDTLFTLKVHLSLANMWDCIPPWAFSREIRLRHLVSLAASLASCSFKLKHSFATPQIYCQHVQESRLRVKQQSRTEREESVQPTVRPSGASPVAGRGICQASLGT